MCYNTIKQDTEVLNHRKKPARWWQVDYVCEEVRQSCMVYHLQRLGRSQPRKVKRVQAERISRAIEGCLMNMISENTALCECRTSWTSLLIVLWGRVKFQLNKFRAPLPPSPKDLKKIIFGENNVSASSLPSK